MEEPTAEEELEADKEISQPEPEPEQSSENQLPETPIAQDQDSPSLVPSSDAVSGFAAELKDNPNILNLQDNIPNRQDIITSRLIWEKWHKNACFAVYHYPDVSENVTYIA